MGEPKKLTKAERGALATRIAKDVLKQVDTGKLQPRRGIYVSTFYLRVGDLQKQLKELPPDKTCEVCALGALFCARVLRVDDFQIPPDTASISQKNCLDKLKVAFSDKQLANIENCFESIYAETSYWDCETRSRSRNKRYGSLFRDDKARLRAIMKNIVANGGVFKVPGVRELLAQRAKAGF